MIRHKIEPFACYASLIAATFVLASAAFVNSKLTKWQLCEGPLLSVMQTCLGTSRYRQPWLAAAVGALSGCQGRMG